MDKPKLRCKHPVTKPAPSCAKDIERCTTCRAFVDLTLPRNKHLLQQRNRTS